MNNLAINIKRIKNAAFRCMKLKSQNIRIEDFTYELPDKKIAEFPLEKRDHSKLLVYKEGFIEQDRFYHIDHYVPPGSTLILNNTKVIEARLLFQKETGGVIEIFCLEPNEQFLEQAMLQKENAVWQCLIGGASKWKPGQVLHKNVSISGELVQLSAHYLEKKEDYFLIHFSWEPGHYTFVELVHAAGAIPLPPYIKRSAEKLDTERYQTVFSKYEGSVAAPTAALHFTQGILDNLQSKQISIDYVTLHVGAGTFKPVKTERMAEHHMHGEQFTVKKETLELLLASKKIIAVGTTSLRTLESLYWLGLKELPLTAEELQLEQWEAYDLAEDFPGVPYQESLQNLLHWMAKHSLHQIHCRTSLLIVPGYEFKIPEGLITNFHQPQSTLLLLVAAFIGEDWRKVYQYALNNEFRFLSYGDSSLLWKNNEKKTY